VDHHIKLDSNICYVIIPGNQPGKRIGVVKQGEAGYYEARGYDDATESVEQAQALVNGLNATLGIPEEVAQSALYGSMFGWHVPAAAVANTYFKTMEGK